MRRGGSCAPCWSTRPLCTGGPLRSSTGGCRPPSAVAAAATRGSRCHCLRGRCVVHAAALNATETSTRLAISLRPAWRNFTVPRDTRECTPVRRRKVRHERRQQGCSGQEPMFARNGNSLPSGSGGCQYLQRASCGSWGRSITRVPVSCAERHVESVLTEPGGPRVLQPNRPSPGNGSDVHMSSRLASFVVAARIVKQ